jgi:hypothetical protein
VNWLLVGEFETQDVAVCTGDAAVPVGWLAPKPVVEAIGICGD